MYTSWNSDFTAEFIHCLHEAQRDVPHSHANCVTAVNVLNMIRRKWRNWLRKKIGFQALAVFCHDRAAYLYLPELFLETQYGIFSRELCFLIVFWEHCVQSKITTSSQKIEAFLPVLLKHFLYIPTPTGRFLTYLSQNKKKEIMSDRVCRKLKNNNIYFIFTCKYLQMVRVTQL